MQRRDSSRCKFLVIVNHQRSMSAKKLRKKFFLIKFLETLFLPGSSMKIPKHLFHLAIQIYCICLPSEILSSDNRDLAEIQRQGKERLEYIHSQANLIHGKFAYEYPEQLLTAMYLPGEAKVLELGSNLGNNSIVISSILIDSKNLVTLETREEAVKCLIENRESNNLKFNIEWAALSEVPLVQKGWNTIPSNYDLEGWFRVNTITFDQLEEKYNLTFDTLVVDAEGALYQILMDKPDLLTNIKLIIIENDFACQEHCFFVLDLFRQNGFDLIYNEGPKYYGENAFNQVWRRS